ncbi:endogenous retrovirus group V member 2 Env polyprotein-like [Elephas maximus indicus]|uniref:endogenous retrovirus group V member 2 Env polyprotein-like n=1 Tax=Elephas maximus indicus TaxID=99487 RepID=UPI002116E32D|nr:endogenous retrovirus group V member 2 Env polyprotein-like [Elephas maximus indicus]
MNKLIVFVFLFLLVFKAQAWKDNAFVRLAQAVASAGNLKDFWICHPSPHSVHSFSDPLALPILNYTGIPDATLNSSIRVIRGIQVRLWHPPNSQYDFTAPCFNLTAMRNITIDCSEYLESDGTVGVTWASHKDWAPPECKHSNGSLNQSVTGNFGFYPYRTRSFNFLLENCRHSVGEYERDSFVCREFPYPHDWGRLSICDHSLSENWLIRANNTIPYSASVKVTGAGALCAPKGYVFLCGGSDWYKDNEIPQNSDMVWALQCLDGWRMSGACTLGTLGVPLELYPYNESIRWASTLNIFERIRNKRDYSSVHVSFIRNIFSRLGVHTNEVMIRNLSHIMTEIADSTAQTIQDQQKSLNSLSRVVLNNRIALDFLLAQQGGICVTATTSCCVWINSTGQVEQAVTKIQQHARLLRQVQFHLSGESGMFSMLFTDVRSWTFAFILAGIIILITIIVLCGIIACASRSRNISSHTVFLPFSDSKKKEDMES